jgi:hypothetical protein
MRSRHILRAQIAIRLARVPDILELIELRPLGLIARVDRLAEMRRHDRPRADALAHKLGFKFKNNSAALRSVRRAA